MAIPATALGSVRVVGAEPEASLNLLATMTALNRKGAESSSFGRESDFDTPSHGAMLLDRIGDQPVTWSVVDR